MWAQTTSASGRNWASIRALAQEDADDAVQLVDPFNATMKSLIRAYLPAPFVGTMPLAQIVLPGAGMDTRGLRLKATPATKASHSQFVQNFTSVTRRTDN